MCRCARLATGHLWSISTYKPHLKSPCICTEASPERINVSPVPAAPGLFFQLPCSHLARPGFSEH